MATTLYLRNTNASAGPSAFVLLTDDFPSVPADKNTNKEMSASKGSSQTNINGSFNNGGSTKRVAARRWVSPPLAAQTLTGGQAGWKVAMAVQESSLSMNLYHDMAIYIWRSGSGNVKTIVVQTDCGTEHGTSETGCVITAAGASGDFNIQAGDRLVVEDGAFLNNTKSVAYTGTWYYDGTTDPVEGTGTSDAASYVYSPQTLTFQGAIIERTPSENLGSVTDSVQTILRRVREVSETAISVSDSTESLLRRDQAISEPSISVSDGVELWTKRQRDVTEPSISVSDDVAAGKLFLASVDEVHIGKTTEVTELGFYVPGSLDEWGLHKVDRLVVDGFHTIISSIDNVARAKWFTRSADEPSISVSDGTESLLQRDRAISEPSVSVDDTTERLLRRIREISEPSISVDDTPLANLVFSCSASESLGSVSDTPVYILLRDRSIGEPSISVADLPEVLLRRIREIIESLGAVTDYPERGLLIVRSVGEPSISASDATERLLRRVRDVNEPAISVSDITERLLRRTREVSESAISVSDVPALNFLRARSLIESLGSVTDATLRTFLRERTISEPAISVADLAVAYIPTPGVERDVTEPPILVSDSVFAYKYIYGAQSFIYEVLLPTRVGDVLILPRLMTAHIPSRVQEVVLIPSKRR